MVNTMKFRKKQLWLLIITLELNNITAVIWSSFYHSIDSAVWFIQSNHYEWAIFQGTNMKKNANKTYGISENVFCLSYCLCII